MMMNQLRSRKVGAAGELARSRLSKNSGDASKSMTRDGTKDFKEHFKPQQQQNNTRIPKDIRYDLENALVGLCDVWFEDIKPYLLRNNVKLHVQYESGPDAAETAAGGDRGRLPLNAAPGGRACSHVDPGAATDLPRRCNVNSADCCSVLPATSRTPLRRPPLQPCNFKLLAKSQRLPTSLTAEKWRNSDEHVVEKRHANLQSAVVCSTDAAATLQPRRYFNPAIPLNVSFTMQPSYIPGDLPTTQEVLAPQDIPHYKDHYTQTEKLPKRRRFRKRIPLSSPEKRDKTSPIRKKRHRSPLPRYRMCIALRQKPSAHPLSTHRQSRTNSSSPLRKRPHATVPLPATICHTSPPAGNKPTNTDDIERFSLDAQVFQDELDPVLLWATAKDTYFMHEILKDTVNTAIHKVSRKTKTKKGRVQTMPPWK